MDLVAVSQAVAASVAVGGSKELAEDAGRGLAAAIVERVRKVFGADARSVDALERTRESGAAAAVEELAAALRWYAERDQAFAVDLMRWAELRAGPASVSQKVSASRDVYVAGRDQTVTNYLHREN